MRLRPHERKKPPQGARTPWAAALAPAVEDPLGTKARQPVQPMPQIDRGDFGLDRVLDGWETRLLREQGLRGEG